MQRVFSVIALIVVAAIILVAVIPALAGGPIDIAGYCASQGKGAPYSQGRDWYCENWSFNLSMDEVCRWQYGSGAYAVNPDPMNAGGWSCEGGSSTSASSGGGSNASSSGGSSVNVAGYCSAQGQGAPYTSGRDWFCGGSSFNLSMDEVCAWQNGSRAVSDNVMDPYSWRCTGSGNGPVSAPVQSQPQATSVPQSTGGTTTTSSGGSGNTNSSNIYVGFGTPPSSGDYVQVLESELRIREFPGTTQRMLGYVRQWDYYPLYETRDCWGLISGSLGSGWVSLEFVEVFHYSEPQLPPITVEFPYELRPTVAFVAGAFDVDWSIAQQRVMSSLQLITSCGILIGDATGAIAATVAVVTLSTPANVVATILAGELLLRISAVTIGDDMAECAMSLREVSDGVVEIWRTGSQ